MLVHHTFSFITLKRLCRNLLQLYVTYCYYYNYYYVTEEKSVHRKKVQCCSWVVHCWIVSISCFAKWSVWNSGSTFVSVVVLLGLPPVFLFSCFTVNRNRFGVFSWEIIEGKVADPCSRCQVSHELDLKFQSAVSVWYFPCPATFNYFLLFNSETSVLLHQNLNFLIYIIAVL